MSDLINKMTLYDIISTAIPGSIALLAFMTAVPAEVIDIKNEINNDLILFGIFIVIAYCVGWILSELMSMCLKVISKIGNERSHVFLFMILFVLCLCFSFLQLDLYGLSLFLLTITYIIFFILLFVIDGYKSSKKKKNNSEYQILVKKCQELLIKEYGSVFADVAEDQLIEKIETMSQSAYFIIQTDAKYSRVHNYNASKFFSRNLAGSVLCVIGVLYFHMCLMKECFLLWNWYSLAIFLCIISFYALVRKYQGFKEKVKILVITYYIDYLKMGEGNGQ